MSLACGILKLVQDAALREGFGRVAQLRLEAGKLFGLELSALRFALQVVSRGTCLEAAEFLIDEPPGQGGCLNCAQNVEEHERGQSCPRCGGWQMESNGSDRLRVVDMQVLD